MILPRDAIFVIYIFVLDLLLYFFICDTESSRIRNTVDNPIDIVEPLVIR